MKVRFGVFTAFLAAFAVGIVAAQAPATDATKPNDPAHPKSTAPANPKPPEPAHPKLSEPAQPIPPEPARPNPHPIAPAPKPKPVHPFPPNPPKKVAVNQSLARRQPNSCPVMRETPEIAWYPLFRHIKFGEPLTSDQLNATSDLPGTFSYNPSFGYIPPRGTLLVTLTFLPSDMCRYNVVTTSESIIVD